MWGPHLLTSAHFGTQQRAAFILLHAIKGDAAQTAMVQSSDPSLDFQQERYKPDCLSPGQRLPLPSFLACCVKPVLLPVGSVAHRLLKYWHPHVIVFFLLLPGSIKKPVFLLTLLCFSCLSSSSWEGKVNAYDEVIPVCWHLLLQIISIKTNSQCFWGSAQAALPIE